MLEKITFDEYQSKTVETAIYPKIGHHVIYPTLGLADEAGEVAGKIKKIFRDNDGHFDDDRVNAISKELGDVLWYLSQVATELGLSLGEIASENLEKLSDRKKRNVLKGDGDNR